MKRITIGVLLLMALWSSCVRPQTELLAGANALMRQGQANAAVELLLPAAATYASDARYHYILGTAYLDSGKAEDAIASLREALRLQPDLLQAEAELGRAHLLTGNYLAAQLSFDRVRDGNAPQEVLASIDRFIEGVHSEVNAQRPRLRGSVSFGIGHDSNVNTATSAQQVLLPILGGITATLDSAARARSDSFKSFGAEASGFVPLDPDTELFAGGNLLLKANNDVDTFDFLTGSANGGIRHDFGPRRQSQVSLSVQMDSVHRDNIRVRDSYGLSAEYRRIVHPLAEISAYVQSSKLDYIRDDFRDAQREVIGIAVNPVAFGKRLFNLPPVLAIYGGREQPDGSNLDHLGNEFNGLRTTAIYLFNSRAALIGGLSYERRHYGAPDPLFGATRIDRQTDVTLALNYSLNRDWSLTPMLSFTDNRSNLDVFRYERTAVSIATRMSF